MKGKGTYSMQIPFDHSFAYSLLTNASPPKKKKEKKRKKNDKEWNQRKDLHHAAATQIQYQ